MKIFNEKLIFDLELKYSDLLLKLGLAEGNNRFKKAFNNYRQLSDEMRQAGTQVIPEKWSTKFKHAVFDLTELLDIYSSLQDYPDTGILKSKIKTLNEGTVSPADETGTNTSARNVQFELKLFSELTNAGIRCRLRDPNPDIEVTSSLIGHTYAIECKRVYSFRDSSIHDNINSARDQLKGSLADNPNQTGIIAIDISRRLTQGTHYLRAKNDAVALARLSHELEQFGTKYSRYYTSDKIGDRRILAVLLHASMYTYIEDRALASHGAYTMIYEIHPDAYSKLLIEDMKRDIFSPLSRYKNTNVGRVHAGFDY